MEFDLKVFFKDPPRIKEDVKAYMHEIASRIVIRAAQHIRTLGIDRILPRHVKIVIFHMTQDPLTRMNRHGLCTQQTKVKSIAKVFQRTIDLAEEALKSDAKYGGIDKKIVKGTQLILTEQNVRHSTGASVCLAACVAEICGIMLNSTQSLMEDRTINLNALHSYSTTHCISTGDKCTNSSLLRFLHYIDTQVHAEVDPVAMSDSRAKEAEAEAKPSTRPESPKRKLRRLEEKTVSFDDHASTSLKDRPSTPDTCFWED